VKENEGARRFYFIRNTSKVIFLLLGWAHILIDVNK
jgi:hypothetical protein